MCLGRPWGKPHADPVRCWVKMLQTATPAASSNGRSGPPERMRCDGRWPRSKSSDSLPASKVCRREFPEIQELQELRAVRSAGIEIQPARDGCGNAQLRRRGPAVFRGSEGVADGLQRTLLARGKFHGRRASLANRERQARPQIELCKHRRLRSLQASSSDAFRMTPPSDLSMEGRGNRRCTA